MRRHKMVVATALTMSLAAAACGSKVDDAAPVTTEPEPAATATPTTLAPAPTAVATTAPTTAAPTTMAPPANAMYPGGLRNVRYCEVLFLGREGADFVAHVWNTMGHSDCPQSDWEALDPTALAAQRGAPLALLNGPRYWTLDSIDATVQNGAPVATFGAIEMFEAATVNLGPELPDQAPFVERKVKRVTVFRFDAGTEVYELTDPTGTVYVMQSFSQQIDPTQTIDGLTSLGSRLQLPAGWTFTARVLDQQLELLSTDGIATVIQDNFQNSYQRDDTTA